MQRLSRITRLALLACLGLVTGCAGVKRGNLDRVSALSDGPRVGHVYLVRGLVGIFSTGMDELAAKIREAGVNAEVFQGEQRRELTEAIARAYADHNDSEPLVLIGHSYGADDVLRIAAELEKQGITVDLLITCDAVTPPPVPGNIVALHNYYKPGALDALPWLRGIPLTPDEQGRVQLANYNLSDNRRDLLEPNTNHFNIEKNPKLHEDILKLLEETCPPRPVWAARRRQAPLMHAVSNPDEEPRLQTVDLRD